MLCSLQSPQIHNDPSHLVDLSAIVTQAQTREYAKKKSNYYSSLLRNVDIINKQTVPWLQHCTSQN